MILPCTAFTEKTALYLNLEGRPQFTTKVTDNLGKAVDSWKIFRALADQVKVKLNYNDHEQLLQELFKKYPHFALINNLTPAKWESLTNQEIKLEKENINTTMLNFYQTCSISRSSSNMASCVKEFVQNK